MFCQIYASMPYACAFRHVHVRTVNACVCACTRASERASERERERERERSGVSVTLSQIYFSG